jgi:hypothetical protein
MMNTARLYLCARCLCQVIICSHCDHGNLYCSGSCSSIARKISVKAAGKRYQDTRRGRTKHAARQSRYRSRCKKVTHQGSPLPPSNALLGTHPEAASAVAAAQDGEIRCAFCNRLCSDFLRLDFLHTSSPYPDSDWNIMPRHPVIQAQAP